MIRVTSCKSGNTVAVVTTIEAVHAVSRLFGREWLVVASPARPVFEYYFDGARSPEIY